MGRIDFKQNDDSGSGTGVSGSIYSISQSTTGQGSGLAFNTGVPSSATERMRIDSSGTISIGPSTTSSEIYFNYNNTNNKGGLKIDYSTGELRLTAGESGNTYRQAFYLNGSERMRIDNSGNIRFTGTAPSSGDEITQLNFYNTSSSLNLARITGIRQAGGTNYGALTFSTTNSGTIAERMRITSAGNVGIGTTSPNADLEVYTDIGGGNTLRLNTNFGGGNTVDINPYITGINNGGMEIKLAGSQKVVINPSGNVGIGTTSPAQKLDVVGIIKSSGISNSLMFSDRNTASNSWEWYSSGNNAGLYKNHNGPGTVMTIDSSDNVGIGTTSPQTKLDVDGGVRIKTVEYTWHRANPITSTDSYRHIKTTLYAGSGGNTMHIMGGFTLKAYAYASGGYGEGSCMFHNWSGILYSLSVTNRGQWSNFVRSPYISSDGYVVIVFEHNTYSQPVIDFYQFYTPYGWRNVTVSADTTSNSSTGVY
jgi:hypothetical protein